MSTQPVAVPEATAPVVEQPKTKIRREIQPKDAAGNPIGAPHVYEGDSEQEVMDKMAAAIANGTLKIRELSRKVTLEPSTFTPPEGAELYQDIPEPKVRELTPAERLEISRKFADPEKVQEAYIELHTATSGLSPKQAAELQVIQARAAEKNRVIAEAQQFAEAHPDVVAFEENNRAILDYIKSRGLALSLKNFERAYKELGDNGLLLAAPEPPTAAPSPAPEVRIDPPKPAASQTAIPLAMNRSNASGSGTPVRKKGPSARELAMMSPAELKKYYEETGQWPKK